MDDQAVIWSIPAFGEVELLRATYRMHAFARHAHETFAVGAIESGVGTFWCRGADRVAPAGRVVVIPPGEVHTGGAGGASVPLVYQMLYPTTALMRRAAEEAGMRGEHPPEFARLTYDDEPLARALLRMRTRVQHTEDALALETDLLALLVGLVARHAEGGARPDPGRAEPAAVHRAREYIEECYATGVSLDALASAAGLSPSYLVRAFRRAFGLPPHAYLVQVRVRHAKRLLRDGVPPSGVAFATGFADQSHLTRHFKRHVGVTPARFRAQVKNVQDRGMHPR